MLECDTSGATICICYIRKEGKSSRKKVLYILMGHIKMIKSISGSS